MRSSNKLCYLLFTLLIHYALSSAHIDIVSPGQLAEIFDNDAIPFGLSRYGKVAYGSHFVGALARANPPDACNLIGNFSAGVLEVDSGVIAVIESGGCTERVKILNAQLAGAKMVILINKNQDVPNFTGKQIEDNLHIPAVIISRNHGDRLVGFIQNVPFPPPNPDSLLPIISVSFPFESKRDTVALDFWFSISDYSLTAHDFINKIKEQIDKSEGAFEFTPHYITWSCALCKKLDYKLPVPDCLSGGRYCAVPPADNIWSGANIVREDLKHKCLWTIDPATWWLFTEQFTYSFRAQADVDAFSNVLLSKYASTAVIEETHDCMIKHVVGYNETKQFDLTLNDHTYLARERELQLAYDITEHPILLINHRPYTGSLENINDIVKKACEQLSTPRGQCKGVVTNREGSGSSHGISGSLILELFVILSVMAVAIFYCYRRLTKRKLSSELSFEANNIVSRYMAMRETSTSGRKQSDDEGNE